jgi:Leucine-rich repeat (LRR) protein
MLGSRLIAKAKIRLVDISFVPARLLRAASMSPPANLLPLATQRAITTEVLLSKSPISRIVYCLSLIGLCGTIAAAQQRKWTDTTGKFSVDAEFVEAKDGTVSLKRSSGKTVKVPVARLSAGDQKYVAEQQAVATIRQLGGDVELHPIRKTAVRARLYGKRVTDDAFEVIRLLDGLARLDVSYTKITDAGLQHLRNLPRLEQLDLTECEITDAGIEHIKGLKSLILLSLNGTQITDAGTKGVMELTNLGHLRLNRTQVTDEGLQGIGNLKRLATLDLSNTQITDATLERFQGLSRLGLLDLSSTGISDDGLKHLQGLEHLTFLTLSDTKVTDAGLQHLRNLPALNALSLCSTQVTDTGMPHLNDLPKLRIVRLINTDVTDAGVKRLERLTLGGSIELVTRPKTDEDMTWLSQLAELSFLTLPKSSDVVDKEFIYSLLLRARSLEPGNAKWAIKLGDWHASAAVPFTGLPLAEGPIVEELRKAIEYFEEAYPNIDDADSKNYTLLKMTQASFDAGEFEKAKRYATDLIATSAGSVGDGRPDGDAIHHGNLILGRVACRDGDIQLAKNHLLEAGKTSGSPVLGSFGPKMTLAKQLLEKGEQEVVLDYFELCKKFWTGASHHQKLDQWAAEVRNGKVPDFGTNLD